MSTSLPPVSQGVVSTQLELAHNDTPAPQPPPRVEQPEPPTPPPVESGRGRSVDTSA